MPIKAKTSWMTIEGIGLILLGIVALVLPIAAGLAVAHVFGWILIVSGILGLVAVVVGSDHTHIGWSLLSALVAVIVGLLLVWSPVAGALGLVILMGAYFLIDGVALIALSLDQRRRKAPLWGWVLACGIFDLLLAALLAFATPILASWFMGVLLGVDLLAAGLALIGLGAGLSRSRDVSGILRRSH